MREMVEFMNSKRLDPEIDPNIDDILKPAVVAEMQYRRREGVLPLPQ